MITHIITQNLTIITVIHHLLFHLHRHLHLHLQHLHQNTYLVLIILLNSVMQHWVYINRKHIMKHWVYISLRLKKKLKVKYCTVNNAPENCRLWIELIAIWVPTKRLIKLRLFLFFQYVFFRCVSKVSSTISSVITTTTTTTTQ